MHAIDARPAVRLERPPDALGPLDTLANALDAPDLDGVMEIKIGDRDERRRRPRRAVAAEMIVVVSCEDDLIVLLAQEAERRAERIRTQ